MLLTLNKDRIEGSGWSPSEPVIRILRGIGLTSEESFLFMSPFEEFRHQGPDSPLRFGGSLFADPLNLRSSDDWFRLLFSPNDYDLYFDSLTQQAEVGVNPIGLNAQINLDNIGRDFLCLIYYRQRIVDLMNRGGLRLVIKEIFREEEQTPPEFNNLTNSLIRVEALTDWLSLNDYPLTSRQEDRDSFLVLSDPPERRIPLTELPSVGRILRDTSNLSRYIRSLSVCLQDGGEWDDLRKICRQDFGLPERFCLLSDRRILYDTDRFCLETALNREFSLWERDRLNSYPSIRIISDLKGIPYSELLRVEMYGFTNTNQETPVHRFDGLRFLREGLSPRFVKWVEAELTEKSFTFTEGGPIL